MNKKILKISSIVFFIIVFSFGTYKLSYWIGETYFFDKLFYKKSSLHGYLEPGNWDYFANYSKQNRFIKNRSSDLYALMYKQSKILGVSTSDDVFNIAIIGDSMTYGLGVKENQTLVSILEKKLNEIKPTKIYNYSQPGDDVINNYTKYKAAKKNQNIDLFIITLVDNDLVFNDLNRYPQNKNTYLEILAECEKKPKFFKYDDIESFNEAVEKLYYPSFLEEYSNICFLEKIMSHIDMSNTFFLPFGYIPNPEKFTQNEPKGIEEKLLKIFQNYYKIVSSQNDGHIINPTKSGLQFSPISKSEDHSDKNTHIQYSDILYQEITNNSKWNF